MIKSHIDEQGNKFYTRKQLESVEEVFITSFMEEVTLFSKLYELFISTIKKVGINENTNEEDLTPEVKDYFYNTLAKLNAMKADIIDTYYIDVLISDEELKEIMESKVESIDDITNNMQSIAQLELLCRFGDTDSIEKLINNNK